MEYIFHDKKNEQGHLHFALPNGIGAYKLSGHIQKERVEEALQQY